MKLSSIVAAATFVAISSSAFAETASQRLACTPDVWRLCASDIPNVSAIKSCLRREHAQLSSACRTVMETFDQPTRAKITLTAN